MRQYNGDLRAKNCMRTPKMYLKLVHLLFEGVAALPKGRLQLVLLLDSHSHLSH